jgi:hypothetical protein
MQSKCFYGLQLVQVGLSQHRATSPGIIQVHSVKKHRKRSQKTNGFRPVSSRLVRKIFVNLDIIQHDLSTKIKLSPASVRFSPPPSTSWQSLLCHDSSRRSQIGFVLLAGPQPPAFFINSSGFNKCLGGLSFRRASAPALFYVSDTSLRFSFLGIYYEKCLKTTE